MQEEQWQHSGSVKVATVGRDSGRRSKAAIVAEAGTANVVAEERRYSSGSGK